MSVTGTSLAWIVGIIACRSASTFPITTVLLSLFVFAACAFYPPRVIGDRRRVAVFSAVILLSWSVSAFFTHVPSTNISRYASNEKRVVVGRVLCPIEHRIGKETFLVAVSNVGSADGRALPASGRLRVSVYESPPPVSCESVISFATRIRRPKNFESPGAFNFVNHLADQRIFAVAGVTRWDDVTVLSPPSRFAWRAALERFRTRVAEGFDRTAGSTESAVLKAMVIGDSGAVPSELRRIYAASGVAHLLSISGIHVGVIALFLVGVLRAVAAMLPDRAVLMMNRRFWTASRLSAVFAVPFIVFYVFMSGAHVPTQRAAVMIITALIALMIHRETRIAHLLALAALVLLIVNPSSLWSVGFQLSFVSVLSLILFERFRKTERDPLLPPEAESRLGRIRVYALDLLWASAAASIGTAPLTAFYFHQISLIGLATNLFMVPLSGLVLTAGFLSIGITCIWPDAAAVVMWLAGIGAALMNGTARLAAAVPGGAVHPASPPVYLILAYYGLLAGVVWGRTAMIKAVAAVGWLVIVGILFTRPWDPVPAGEFRVAFLDVGQGDSAVIEAAGRALVVDGGGSRSENLDLGEAVVEPYLRERRIRRIEWVAASHPQLDHMEGLIRVVRNFDVHHMLDNGVERDWPISREWARVSMSRDIPRHVATPGLVLIHSEGIRAEVLWPSDDAREEGGSRRRLNNASAVIKVLNKHWAVLFTGDLEEEGEAALSASGADLASDILKVPHHGSRGSLDLEFLTKVNPKFAVISAGKDNRYGHPAPEAIEAYRSMGARLLRTDRDGTVVIESCGRDLKIRRTMETRLRTVSWNAGLFSSEIDNYRRLWGSGWEIITGVD